MRCSAQIDGGLGGYPYKSARIIIQIRDDYALDRDAHILEEQQSVVRWGLKGISKKVKIRKRVREGDSYLATKCGYVGFEWRSERPCKKKSLLHWVYVQPQSKDKEKG